jgi:putative transposase
MPGWAHSPVHYVSQVGTYFITGGTYHKLHLIDSRSKLGLVQATMQDLAGEYALTLEAWAVFSNHYHVIVNCTEEPVQVRPFVRHLHSQTAREINALDGIQGRKVWFQYRDTLLRDQKSYYARLNYVKQNPVHHGLVKLATEYEWCSASWFLASSEPAHHKTVTSFKVDLQIAHDPYLPVMPTR